MPYRSPLTPRAHQLRAEERLANIPMRPSREDVFALLMEMGTGKTKVTIDEWGKRAYGGDLLDCVIVAPAGSYNNWTLDRSHTPSEFKKNLDPQMYERTVIATWRASKNKDLKEQLRSLVSYNHDKKVSRILNMNTEAFRTDKGRAMMREFLDSSGGRGVYFAVDESTAIKNRKADQTEGITEAGWHPSVGARRILTGMISPNSPFDVFSQFRFLDENILGFRDFHVFKRRYAVLRKAQFPGKKRMSEIVVRYQNVDDLHARIAPYSFRVLKEECLDLPKKQYTVRDVGLHSEQERIYNELKLTCQAELASHDFVTATMVLAQRIRLDQVLCGHVVDENGLTHDVPEYRTRELMEILQEIQHRSKVIIWTSHDYVIRKLKTVLEEEFGRGSVAQFWGGNRSSRHEDENRFLGDPKCRFMVATPAAGGRGNTWVNAGYSIYYNNTDNLEHRAQSEDRNHRDGLTGPHGAGSVLYIDMIAQGTLDVRKVENLRRKINLSAQVSGDPYRDWLI